MRGRIWRWGVVLLALWCAAMSPMHVAAQQPPALTLRVDGIDLAAFPQVTLQLNVRDANGVPLPDLPRSAFEVVEEGVAAPVVTLESVVARERAVALVLVIDVSGSMAGQPLADIKVAVRALIDQLGRADQVALIAFAGRVALDETDPTREHPPTTDHAAIMALLDSLQAKGGTPLYDALYKGVLWAQELALGHRAVILFTDGVDEDPGSRVASADTPILAATRLNLPIFTIGLKGVDERLASGYLERVARSTGGSYQETPDPAQLRPLFQNVLDRLKQQYRLVYRSGLPADGREHRIQVRVSSDDRSAETVTTVGPLPFIPTATPLPTATSTATPTVRPTRTPLPTPTPTFTRTATPTLIATASPTATHTPLPISTQVQASPPAPMARLLGWTFPWVLALGGLVVLALIVTGVALLGGRWHGAAVYCANCGRALTEPGPCPACGDTRRLRRL